MTDARIILFFYLFSAAEAFLCNIDPKLRFIFFSITLQKKQSVILLPVLLGLVSCKWFLESFSFKTFLRDHCDFAEKNNFDFEYTNPSYLGFRQRRRFIIMCQKINYYYVYFSIFHFRLFVIYVSATSIFKLSSHSYILGTTVESPVNTNYSVFYTSSNYIQTVRLSVATGRREIVSLCTNWAYSRTILKLQISQKHALRQICDHLLRRT